MVLNIFIYFSNYQWTNDTRRVLL